MSRLAARPIRRVLVANRGEIAVRVMRACEEADLEAVLAASEIDATGFAARTAPELVVLGPAPPSESYLNSKRILAAARERRCDAIHPGYGFLAENPGFAAAVADAGLIFIGPPPGAMAMMGDKIAARQAMEQAGVPVLPGVTGRAGVDLAAARRAAGRLGFPLLIKAAAGGGGRGIRIVRQAGELEAALAAARRESEGAFGDGRVMLERFIEEARHIEVQVLADHEGNCIHLGERECSIQRRFQKIVEEAPSPFVTAALRQRLGETAVAAARACGYVNAGTVEFLVAPDGTFYFLEMNARIQVEHPVTEAVTGIDLVRAQLAIAGGGPLPASQDEIVMRGHAIECRITAEDPARDFAPCAGKVGQVVWPTGPGIRVDAGIESGDTIGVHYDSLIAKLIAHGPDRMTAVRRLDRALGSVVVLGVETIVPYLQAVLRHPLFRAGQATTAFVAREMAGWPPPGETLPDEALVAAAVAEVLGSSGGGPVSGRASAGTGPDPWDRSDRFRVGGS